MTAGAFGIIAVLILLNALYVAAEFAAVGARVSRVEEFAARGSRLARAVLPIVNDSKRLDAYIAACQIGITVSSLVLGAFGQATVGIALGSWLHESGGMEAASAFGLSALIVLIVLTSLQVVLGELAPKTVALQYPVRTAMYTYLPMKWSRVLFMPFIKFLNGSGNLVLRLIGADHSRSHHHVHSPEEIEMLVRESADQGAIARGESERLRAGLRFARRTATQLMVPRRNIVGLDIEDDPERILDRVRNSPYTRLVVYRSSLDDVLGFLHIKDFAAQLARGGPPAHVEALVRPLLMLPDGLSAEQVLAQLRQQRARLALVVSEYGDVEGLVSLQDLVSEVLGETADEFKTVNDEAPVALGDGSWRLSGQMPADEFIAWAQEQGKSRGLVQGDAETLAGLIMRLLDAVPVEGETVCADGLQLRIERMRGRAIESVIASRNLPDGGEISHE